MTTRTEREFLADLVLWFVNLTPEICTIEIKVELLRLIALYSPAEPAPKEQE